jgi:hypothetical protein
VCNRQLWAFGYRFKERGLTEIKGKGLMETFFLVGRYERNIEEPKDEFTPLPETSKENPIRKVHSRKTSYRRKSTLCDNLFTGPGNLQTRFARDLSTVRESEEQMASPNESPNVQRRRISVMPVQVEESELDMDRHGQALPDPERPRKRESGLSPPNIVDNVRPVHVALRNLMSANEHMLSRTIETNVDDERRSSVGAWQMPCAIN